jgi:hypothetical protein
VVPAGALPVPVSDRLKAHVAISFSGYYSLRQYVSKPAAHLFLYPLFKFRNNAQLTTQLAASISHVALIEGLIE